MTTHTPLIPEYVDDPRMACVTHLHSGLKQQVLTDQQVLTALHLHLFEGWSYQAIARHFRVQASVIALIFLGNAYADLTESERAA